MSIILGIDPGSRVTGYGVIAAPAGQPRYLASGCIRMQQVDMSVRLQTIFSNLTQIIGEYQPDQVAIEQVFVGKSAASALKLGHARGVAMLAACQADVPLAEYSARTIKQEWLARERQIKNKCRRWWCAYSSLTRHRPPMPPMLWR